MKSFVVPYVCGSKPHLFHPHTYQKKNIIHPPFLIPKQEGSSVISFLLPSIFYGFIQDYGLVP